MIVVADSGPIHYLVLIDSVDVMHPLFGRVLIPQAVHRELTRLAAPAAVSRWINNLPPWAEVHPAPSLQEPRFERLGAGEREAILLAREVLADYLLIDDARGRFLAEAQHVRTIGTIGILRSAGKHGLIDFRRSFDKLMATNFRISSAFRRQILEELEGE